MAVAMVTGRRAGGWLSRERGERERREKLMGKREREEIRKERERHRERKREVEKGERHREI